MANSSTQVREYDLAPTREWLKGEISDCEAIRASEAELVAKGGRSQDMLSLYDRRLDWLRSKLEELDKTGTISDRHDPYADIMP